MKVLLLGANGMVGRNVLEHSKVTRFEVLAPPRSELNLFDYQNVRDYFLKNKPELIVHAAGKVGGIQANIHEPVKYFLENLDIGRNVIWGAKESGVKRLINLGSSCMYPRNAANPLTENMILTGELEPTNEGYALAKVATTRFCQYINREDKQFQFKTLIPCNLYGRWDNFNPESSHLISSIIYKIKKAMLSKSKDVDIWGDGKARREFMYVGDFADCIIHSIENFDNLPDVMNVGLGYDYTIAEYYEAVAEVIGYTGQYKYDLTKPIGMNQKLIDTSLQKKFGWQPTTNLIEGINKTYKFYNEKVRCCHNGISPCK